MKLLNQINQNCAHSITGKSMNIDKIAIEYADKVCNGSFPIEYTREQVLHHTANDFVEGYKEAFRLFEKIEKWSKTYQISFQFWGKNNNNIYIAKDDVDLWDSGCYETIHDCLESAIRYIERINPNPPRQVMAGMNENEKEINRFWI